MNHRYLASKAGDPRYRLEKFLAQTVGHALFYSLCFIYSDFPVLL